LKQVREARLEELRNRLAQEHPELGGLVDHYVALDVVARRMHLFDDGQSHAWNIAWWPVVPVLGTFSSGKSTFINGLLEQAVQRTGAQAVDDRFTVLAYAGRSGGRRLPGIALDADPRLPFYRVSERIAELDGGARKTDSPVNSYLQMQMVDSPLLRHLLLVDSPGFDADQSRRTILRLTDHIIELADLVLVFFDARHPEPGAMQDTLGHLVEGIRARHDADKFLFVLNQIDATLGEDNLDEVVASWQRALGQYGMGGRQFYCLFDDSAARLPEGELAQRYRARRDRDRAEIVRRIEQLRLTRSYRLIANLEELTRALEHEVVPQLQRARARWARWVLISDAVVDVALVAFVIATGLVVPTLSPFGLRIALVGHVGAGSSWTAIGITVAVIAFIVLGIHYFLRQRYARWLVRRLPKDAPQGYHLRDAFVAGTRFWLGMARPDPRGWGKAARRRMVAVRQQCSALVRHLNDLHSGDLHGARPAAGAVERQEPQISASGPVLQHDPQRTGEGG
jgi:Dynamin family.